MAAKAVTGRRLGGGTRAGGAGYQLPLDGSAQRVIRVPDEPWNSLKLDDSSNGEGVPGPIKDA